MATSCCAAVLQRKEVVHFKNSIVRNENDVNYIEATSQDITQEVKNLVTRVQVDSVPILLKHNGVELDGYFKALIWSNRKRVGRDHLCLGYLRFYCFDFDHALFKVSNLMKITIEGSNTAEKYDFCEPAVFSIFNNALIFLWLYTHVFKNSKAASPPGYGTQKCPNVNREILKERCYDQDSFTALRLFNAAPP